MYFLIMRVSLKLVDFAMPPLLRMKLSRNDLGVGLNISYLQNYTSIRRALEPSMIYIPREYCCS